MIKNILISFIIIFIIGTISFFVYNDYGIAWDEPIYFAKGDFYINWLNKPRWSNINGFWSIEKEDFHPPLRPLLSGFTHNLFSNKLHLLSAVTSYRISNLFFVIPLITGLFLFMAKRYSLFSAFCTVIIFHFQPQVFYLSHVLNTDYAIAAFMFGVVICTIKANLNYKWLIASSVLIGLAILTKLQGLILFGPVIFFLIYKFYKIKISGEINSKPNIFLLISIFVLPFLMFFLLWPWLWVSPFKHLIQYLNVQIAYSGAPVWYFGKNYINAPWHYPFVIGIVTSPLFYLCFYMFGLFYIVRKGSLTEKFILLVSLFIFFVIAITKTAKYDGIRLFLSAYPLLSIIGGIGIFRLTDSGLPNLLKLIKMTILILITYTLYSSILMTHPYEASYYSEIIGGIDGATKIGFESEYWGSSYYGVLKFMNNYKNKQFCVYPTAGPFIVYLAMGQLVPGVQFEMPYRTCDYLVLLMRQGYFAKDDYINKITKLKITPVFNVSLSKTPLVSIIPLKKQ
jgi:hypothetical protein